MWEMFIRTQVGWWYQVINTSSTRNFETDGRNCALQVQSLAGKSTVSFFPDTVRDHGCKVDKIKVRLYDATCRILVLTPNF